jgi:hypothetical protein
LVWTGDENVVQQERHESGGHARRKKRYGPRTRAEVLPSSSPPLRSCTRWFGAGRFHCRGKVL